MSTLKHGGVLRLYGTLSGDTATVRIRDVMAGRRLSAFIIYRRVLRAQLEKYACVN